MTLTSAGGTRSITTRVLALVLGCAFLVIGALKLSGQTQTVQLFAAIGWGQWFRYLTGALDVAGALLVLSAWQPFYGAIVLGCSVGTAIVLSVVQLHNNPAPGVALFALAAAVTWLTRPRVVKGGSSA
jgi:putative oxidoreductase